LCQTLYYQQNTIVQYKYNKIMNTRKKATRIYKRKTTTKHDLDI
jgi:hypothetical protein